MKRKRRRNFREERAIELTKTSKPAEKNAGVSSWPGAGGRFATVIGIALIVAFMLGIYVQTVQVPPIDYEDSYYLVHNPYVNLTSAFSRFGAVWNEPYFANFHPVTTTTWLVDRALSDKSVPFDGLPFRVTQLFYSMIAASLLIPLYRRLGIPAILAVLGAVLYAVHPIHTEVVAWLSARKDLMSLIFIALSCLSWLWARVAELPSQWRLRHGLNILLVLLAVLSKPIAVILPVLFLAYEFCSEPHAAMTSWRWAERRRHPVLTRTLALTAIFLAVGGVCAVIFPQSAPEGPASRRLVDLCTNRRVAARAGVSAVRPRNGGFPPGTEHGSADIGPAVCSPQRVVRGRVRLDFLGAGTGGRNQGWIAVVPDT